MGDYGFERGKHLFFGFFLGAGIFSAILFSTLPAGSEDAGSFELLAQKEGGVEYFKNPCRSSAFTLVFSFSQDLQDPPGDAFAIINFSVEFQEYIRSLYKDVDYISLYYTSARKIGNRQISVDYIAKKILGGGRDEDINLPDHIEVVMLDEDLMRILDVYNRRCEPLDLSKRVITLINKNSDKKCFE